MNEQTFEQYYNYQMEQIPEIYRLCPDYQPVKTNHENK